MKDWKETIKWQDRKYLYITVVLLIAMVVYQQFLITDLQERMMNIESSAYDDQLNDIRYEAETALRQNEEQDKDIYLLQKHSADQQYRTMGLEWDVYGKSSEE